LFDHELAAIKAAKEVFNPQIQSCYFHFSQNIIKAISTNGLKTFWHNNLLQKFVRQLQGAVFLPINVCRGLWTHTLDHIPYIDEDELFIAGMFKFTEYFKFWLKVVFFLFLSIYIFQFAGRKHPPREPVDIPITNNELF
jgi:hypothetical protein